MFVKTVPVVVSMALIVALAGLAAGCGGDQSEGQGGQNGGGSGERTGAKGEKDRPETKIALGTIRSADAETERIVLRPSAEEQGEKPLRFKLRPKAEILRDGEEIRIEDLEQGQQAQVEYVSREKGNAALAVEVFGGAGGETTG